MTHRDSFIEDTKVNRPILTLKCNYCGNKFTGKNSVHSQELLDKHVEAKHPLGSSVE